MKQLTEDYVSFEIAKLLKEKGFTQFTNMGYMEGVLTNVSVFQVEHNPDRFEVYAYTHQMALKWLREVHNIHIEIRYVPDKFTDEPCYKAMIWDMSEEIGKPLPDDIEYMFYETCVNDAIKYTLENLI